MPSFSLEIVAIGLYSTDIPALEIWVDGLPDSSHSITSSETTLSLTVSYPGIMPASLSFKFDDPFSETGRTIEIQSVKINNRYVNIGNYLSTDSLSKGQSSIVDISGSGFLFDSSEPDGSEFAPTTNTLTSGNDTFRRYDGNDYILDGLAGRDDIHLGSGHDKVTGGTGNDILRGGAGNDLLYGAEGNDVLHGEGGDDTIYGGDDNDRINGNDGKDEIHGNSGNDRLNGHDGEDTITGGLGDDKISGGSDRDFLFGDEGNDQLVGADGNDTIDGGEGDDILYGGNGDDTLDGGAGDDGIAGGNGNDIINGGGGADNLVGGNDNDIIRSGSTETLTATVNSILSANTGVLYSEETNSFYQYITTGTDWISADSAANAATLAGLTGVTGHLATVTSQAESDFITSLVGANRVWISASDAASEGEWIWTSGPEAGQKFWTGGAGGSAYNSLFSNWQVGDPSGLHPLWDYAEILATREWWTNSSISIDPGYVIEWEASSLLQSVEKTTLNGNSGTDDLYGSDGIDVFVIDELMSTDLIYNFNASSRDMLDISNIISGYDPLSDDLTDFIQLTESGGSTTISIDSNGTGSSYIDVAVLEGITSVDLNLMVAGDNLITN